ncbi:unnamed protein product, partial [Soboliphyme baturini]|uniref:RT_RNaseH_2 domain-containing protein n=1 Tax=Soboliphyme baturini TaxID=241478 RepID=A0A183J9J6_9BILA
MSIKCWLITLGMLYQTTDSKNCAAAGDLKNITCQTEFRYFLGLATCNRRFVKDYASIAALCKMDANPSACESIQLTNLPILKHSQFDRELVVDVDVSGKVVGAVLTQVHDRNGRANVVVYGNQSLAKLELQCGSCKNFDPTFFHV